MFRERGRKNVPVRILIITTILLFYDDRARSGETNTSRPTTTFVRWPLVHWLGCAAVVAMESRGRRLFTGQPITNCAAIVRDRAAVCTNCYGGCSPSRRAAYKCKYTSVFRLNTHAGCMYIIVYVCREKVFFFFSKKILDAPIARPPKKETLVPNFRTEIYGRR